jgi:hypothetical protein
MPQWQGGPVPPTPEQRAEAKRIARELAGVGFVLPGTMTERRTRCGKANCHCHADVPVLHGPYHQWTRKVDQKTVTRLMSDEQFADYAPWFENQRVLRSRVIELEQLGLAIVEDDPRWQR